MAIKNRSAAAIVALIVLQGAICPALCAASSSALESSSDGAAESVQMPSCHAMQGNGFADDESSGSIPLDETGRCADCGDDARLSNAAQYDAPDLGPGDLPNFEYSHSGHLTSRELPIEPEIRPPPRPLFLLKNSFLI
jgi:hypothetical protein